MINTIETRLKINTKQELSIDSCVVLWSTYYRKTWKLWNNQKLSETVIYHQLMDLNLFTSAQVGSLINKVKTEHSKFRELTKTQLKQKKLKYTNIQKFIAVEEKNILKAQAEITTLKVKLKNHSQGKVKEFKNIIKEPKEKNYEKITKLTNSIKKKNLILHQKKIKLKLQYSYIPYLKEEVFRFVS